MKFNPPYCISRLPHPSSQCITKRGGWRVSSWCRRRATPGSGEGRIPVEMVAWTRPSPPPSQGRAFPPLPQPLLLLSWPGQESVRRRLGGGEAGPPGAWLPWKIPCGPSLAGSLCTADRQSCHAWSSRGLQKYHPRRSEALSETPCCMTSHPPRPRAALISVLMRTPNIAGGSHLDSLVSVRRNMASESSTISRSLDTSARADADWKYYS